ncbi:hypothetical protein BT96DRAFT_435464 [Gymnopus androsaceus JB14]|uniref:Uncharacterized protein n=1 Tax=Gymnopus androsaceus JB14 TaxID=1447944 RepID=A0A6A4GTI7_9AGAR|nr:hypothetical protein BT96DRAFT_435464 [Gymnopus androsaceus JB14]
MPDDEKEQYIEDCTTVSLLKLMGDRERKLFAFIGFSGLGLETVIKERAKNRAREEAEVVDEEIQEEVHAKSTIWPTGYHAVTIDAYFADCANPDIKRTMQSLFKEHFPHVEKYPHSSIFTHRNRWNSLSTKSREKFVAAGETEAGLWSNVMAKTTDKYQAKRNARRQAKRILDKQSREGSDDDEGEDSGGSYVDSEESVSDSD